MDEKQKIIQEIQRVSNTIAPKKLTRKKFLEFSSTSLGKIRYHFGTWNNAVIAAGLKPNPPDRFPISVYEKISDDKRDDRTDPQNFGNYHRLL